MPTNAFTDLTNTITGGANQNAQQDLTAILEQIQAIQTPTAQQLIGRWRQAIRRLMERLIGCGTVIG